GSAGRRAPQGAGSGAWRFLYAGEPVSVPTTRRSGAVSPRRLALFGLVDRRVDDRLVQAEAPGRRRGGVKELVELAVQSVEVSVADFSGGRRPVEGGVAVTADEGPPKTGVLLRAIDHDEGSEILRSVRVRLGQRVLVLDEPLLQRLLLARF